MQSSQLVYDIVRDRIASGRYGPRQLLREGEVAAALGVSRTPVREALARLAGEGLVSTTPQVGAQVADLTVADVDELFSIRERLEYLSLSYACRRMPLPDLGQLWAIQRASVTAQKEQDVPALIQLNTSFHRQLFALSERPRLLAMLALIHDNLVRYRAITLYDEAERLESVTEHGRFLELIEAGDEPGLYAVVDRHLRRPYTKLRAQVEFLVPTSEQPGSADAFISSAGAPFRQEPPRDRKSHKRDK